MKICIIGAGLSGLATAALLAKDGHEVIILEKNSTPGGRVATLKKEGFTFDIGPSWYMMPDVFEAFFKKFGTTAQKALELKRLDPNYKVFFQDKTHLDIPANKQKTAEIFESVEAGAGAQFLRFVEKAEQKYTIATDSLLYRQYRSVFDLATPEFARAILPLNLFETMEHYTKRFVKSPKLQQILQYTLVFLGGSPKNMLAPFSMMSHVDFNLGVYYPARGMYSVAQTLADLATEHGAKIIYNAPVDKIYTQNAHVSAVKANNKKYKTDLVISATDYPHTESLLDDQSLRQYSDSYWKKQVFEPSFLLLFLGYKGSLPQLSHHNLLLTEKWQDHFDDIYKSPTWPRNPNLYICNPNKTDSSLAPNGHENLFILVPISQKLDDTPKARKEFTRKVFEQIKNGMDIDLSKNLVVQESFSINDFVDRYNSYNGYGMGLSHTFLQTAAFRPKNFHKKIENLFFAGATTVPGIGMPMCLISAELAKDHVDRYREKHS